MQIANDLEKDNMSDRSLNPGDLLIRVNESNVIDILFVMHTPALQAECMTISVMIRNETDQWLKMSLMRDRLTWQEDQIVHAEI